ncbi:hypothetical protein SCHPADRAFT_469182 [Schizopora paradoxa]|uniref:Uncharacterized protein n=1 Tax=Schizopora paradoxa TaxID=27342 RepID=A0A0H2S3D4_9AGAM|nr:hypothetical protein SCHPADRAFT_469182 [Schizopora paradoxa]
MTLGYHSEDSGSRAAKTIVSYRRTSPRPEEQYKMPTPSSSSSSSSPSRIATPVDETHPMLIAFPKHIPRHVGGSTSSGSSSLSLDRLGPKPGSRQRSLSFVPRTPKLSLETSKVKPVPALASASAEYSPLGAFGPTSSAERHLRTVIQNAVNPSRPSIITGIHPTSSHPSPSIPSTPDSLTFSTIKPHHRSPLRSFSSLFPSPYDVDDSEPEHEAEGDNDSSFWPPVVRRSNGTPARSKGRVAHLLDSVPIISRSPSSSPPKSDSAVFASRPFLVSRHSSASVSSHSRTASSPSNVASNSPSSLAGYTRPRAGTVLPPPKSLRPRDSLLRANSGPIHNNTRKNSLEACSTLLPRSGSGLNPALAAVEHASRLRTRCVCVVCGKAGADYPKCPRCGVSWCTRECRMTEKATLGKHVCTKRTS